MAIARDYEEMLSEDLADPIEAADYLSACLEEGDDVFLLGLRDIAKARGHKSNETPGTDVTVHGSDLQRFPNCRNSSIPESQRHGRNFFPAN